MNKSGEFAIFNVKKQFNHKLYDFNKPFLAKLGWRLLFKKVKDNKLISTGRCIDCAANGDRNRDFNCCEYYCPCRMNEQLKQKKIKSKI
jgi:hypothetical protein